MLRKDSIFSKVLWVNSIFISIISIIVILVNINVSKRIILDQAINNFNKDYEYIRGDLIDYNYEIVQALTKISKSDVFKEYLTQSTDDKVKLFNTVVSLGNYMESNKDYLTPKNSHIVAVGNNSMYYSTNSLHWDIELKDVFDSLNISDSNFNIGYRIANTSNIKSVNYKNSLLAIKPLIDKSTKNIYGHMYLVIDERAIYNMYERYLIDGMKFSLISSNGQVLSSSDVDKITTYDNELLEYCKVIEDEPIEIIKNDMKHTLISNYLPFFDAYFVADINEAYVSDSLNSLKYYTALIMAVGLLLIILTIYLISYKFSKPLLSLVDLMSNGSFEPMPKDKVKGKISESYEIIVLTEAYEDMLEKIDYYVKNLMYEEKERRKAELNALQMQINPHFLYNTLSTIKYLAKGEKINEVEKTIDSLISILRNTIGTTEEMATIESEIENLEKYVYINRLRFGGDTNVTFKVSEDCKELLIPKLIIQPFIENAFFHAFSGRLNGEINIFINKSGNFILIEIIDNGIGMEVTDINKLRSKKIKGGIGVKNVDDRIKLIYGEEFGVRLESEVGYGTIVSIKIPININKD